MNGRPSAKVVAAKQREIARRYALRLRNRARPSQTVLRLAELDRLYRYCFGTVLPDNAVGRDRASIALHHLAHLANPLPRMKGWLGRWCPWMLPGEAAAVIDIVQANPLRWRADRLARRLGLTMVERTALRIRTIGAIDCSKRQRGIMRRKAARERARRWRAAKKASGRTQYKGA